MSRIQFARGGVTDDHKPLNDRHLEASNPRSGMSAGLVPSEDCGTLFTVSLPSYGGLQEISDIPRLTADHCKIVFSLYFCVQPLPPFHKNIIHIGLRTQTIPFNAIFNNYI